MNPKLFLYFVLPICYVIYAVVESRRPAHEVNRRKYLTADLAGFFGLYLVSIMSAKLLSRLFVGPEPGGLALSTFAAWPTFLKVLVAVILIDFSTYWIHRLMHLRWVWRTHRWHHTVRELYWVSGFRTSFANSFLHFFPYYLVVYAVFHFQFWPSAAVAFVFAITEGWAHTNTAVSPEWLERILVTPEFHRVHHSRDIEGKNYGSVLSVWDRLFGTYYSPKNLPKNFALGSGEDPVSVAEYARLMIGF